MNIVEKALTITAGFTFLAVLTTTVWLLARLRDRAIRRAKTGGAPVRWWER